MKAYNALDADRKKEVREIFKAGDSDNDRAWSREEMAKFLEERYGKATHMQDLWGLVDADEDGSLDFYEVGTLVYILQMDKSTCGFCEDPIFDDSMWACRTFCTKFVQDGGQCPEEWSTVCDACHSKLPRARVCANSRAHGPLEHVPHDRFLDKANCSLYQQLSLSGIVTCDCCGEAHAKTAAHLPGAPGHVISKGTMCEWCAIGRCANCGETFGSAPRAQPGLWALPGLVCSPACKPASSGSPFPPHALDRANPPDCPTCAPRVRAGTIFVQPHVPPAPQHLTTQPAQDSRGPTCPKLVACTCCGVVHADVPPYLDEEACSGHVVAAPDGKGFLCELCVSWICERCGDSGCSLHHPEPGQWRKCLVHKDKCKKKDSGGWRFSPQALASKAADSGRPQCPACVETFLRRQAAAQRQGGAEEEEEQGFSTAQAVNIIGNGALIGLKAGLAIGSTCSVM